MSQLMPKRSQKALASKSEEMLSDLRSDLESTV